MILRPLNVKEAPAFVNFLVISSFDRQLYERKRHAVLGVNINVKRNIFRDVW